MMLINEASKRTNLTKKAIEYYTEQNLISPKMLVNGYRDFSDDDIEVLSKIYVLRKLGLSTSEIKAVLADEKGDTLKKISVQKELREQRERTKKDILDKLSSDKDYAMISLELKAMEQNATVTEKLLDSFPGYYGRFICLNFARFLNDPIISEEQNKAYQSIIEFLDDVPTLLIPEELMSFLDEGTKEISTNNINEMLEKSKESIENPDKFLADNKEALEHYLAFMQSDEYRSSPMYRLKALFSEFNKTSGYNDIFIPAMKKLSSSYEQYTKQAELANEKLLAKYPEFVNLDN